MTDTIRTLAELNDLFKDNSTEDVSTQDQRDMFQSMLVNGAIGVLNNVVPVTIGTGFTALTILNAQLHARHIAPNLVTSTLTVPAELTTAKYTLAIELNIQAQGAPHADDFTFALFRLPTTKIASTERTLTVADSGFSQLSCTIPGQTIPGGEEIQLAAKAADGPSDLLIVNGSISVLRLGIE